MAFEVVASVTEFEPGDTMAIEVGGIEMVLVRDGDEFHAFDRYCLHQRTELSAGIVSDGCLVCPLHAWRYRLADGALQMPTTYAKLGKYPVRIEGDTVLVSSRK